MHLDLQKRLSVAGGNVGFINPRTSGSCPRPYSGYNSAAVISGYDNDYRRTSNECMFNTQTFNKADFIRPIERPKVRDPKKAVAMFKEMNHYWLSLNKFSNESTVFFPKNTVSRCYTHVIVLILKRVWCMTLRRDRYSQRWAMTLHLLSRTRLRRPVEKRQFFRPPQAHAK